MAFLTEHLANPVPSPALFKRIGDRLRMDVKSFAYSAGIPMRCLNKPDRTRWDDRKIDHIRPYFERATGPGVVAIVLTQGVIPDEPGAELFPYPASGSDAPSPSPPCSPRLV